MQSLLLLLYSNWINHTHHFSYQLFPHRACTDLLPSNGADIRVEGTVGGLGTCFVSASINPPLEFSSRPFLFRSLLSVLGAFQWLMTFHDALYSLATSSLSFSLTLCIVHSDITFFHHPPSFLAIAPVRHVSASCSTSHVWLCELTSVNPVT